MKKTLLFTGLFLILISPVFCQSTSLGKEVKFSLNPIKSASEANGSAIDDLSFVMDLPLPGGNMTPFTLRYSSLMDAQPSDVLTFSATNTDGSAVMRCSLTPSGFTAIMRYENGYYIIEPIDSKEETYRIYNINESPAGDCGISNPEEEKFTDSKGNILSTGNFPVGTQMRTYRFAGAATGEMTTAYGNQTAARDRIISIMNATNLIYQVEASMQFTVISKTTNLSLIFTDPNTDPFSVNPNFGSANDSQNGFNTMNGNSTLLYSEYDMGHTFNNYAANGGARGTGGGSPCVNGSKSVGWTEFGTTTSLGTIVGVFAHEVGHQFNAWHTYNAVGGGVSNPTFCTGGWSNTAAVEPGSGSTLMAYGNNCSSPTNYVLTSPNNESYFHAKSLDQIFTKMSGVSNCFTSAATGNTPPVASVGAAATIPKGTPFSLTGSATDADASDVLSYAWEQIDNATANDQGALGSGINGTGGYPAVNSVQSAPLFRSRISGSPTRTFPDMNFILNNSNNPADNEGEDLPQVARTMNFRLTVRDNKANGGGVDSEALVVTVNNTGPFQITSHNTAATLAAGAGTTVTWAVNGTNALSANVKITMSIDGQNYPFVLAASTTNDGSQGVTIPANFPATTKARIKVSSIGGNGFEWFDINDANLTITSGCAAVASYICPTNSISGNSGNAIFNLSLSNFTGSALTNKTFSTNFAGQSPKNVISFNTAGTACQANDESYNSLVIPFQVTSSGAYSLSANDFVGMTILSSSTISCTGFVGSSMKGNSYSTLLPSVNLNTCTTYYLVLYNAFDLSNVSISFSGGGDIIHVESYPAGFSYTYAAVNNSTGNIASVSASSNFTSLTGGNYTVKGLLYANAVNPSSFVGGSETTAYNSGSCILFSSNSKYLNVIGSPCPGTLTLVSTANDVASGTQTFQSSNAVAPGLIAATNDITGGNVTFDAGKKVEMNPGFSVNGNPGNSAVFLAKIGGCN
ncbi:MAG: M12 family metallo-peptidase [Cytophagales bacterium]|nr:M12 family metallo-peptidase [Cytophagales bacterium]